MSSTRPKPLPRAQQLSDDSAELIYRLKHPHIEERHSYHHMVHHDVHHVKIQEKYKSAVRSADPP